MKRRPPGVRRDTAAKPSASTPASTSASSSTSAAATGVVDARLRAIAQYHKKELFEAFLESLGEEADLQEEMQRIVRSLQVFFNKWTVELIVTLSQSRSLRFNEMRDQLAGISGRTLSQRLKDLEEQGIVARTLHDERPVRIEYSLTKKGMDVAYLSLPLVLYLRQASGRK